MQAKNSGIHAASIETFLFAGYVIQLDDPGFDELRLKYRELLKEKIEGEIRLDFAAHGSQIPAIIPISWVSDHFLCIH